MSKACCYLRIIRIYFIKFKHVKIGLFFKYKTSMVAQQPVLPQVYTSIRLLIINDKEIVCKAFKPFIRCDIITLYHTLHHLLIKH